MIPPDFPELGQDRAENIFLARLVQKPDSRQISHHFIQTWTAHVVQSKGDFITVLLGIPSGIAENLIVKQIPIMEAERRFQAKPMNHLLLFPENTVFGPVRRSVKNIKKHRMESTPWRIVRT